MASPVFLCRPSPYRQYIYFPYFCMSGVLCAAPRPCYNTEVSKGGRAGDTAPTPRLRDEQYREAGAWLFSFLNSIGIPSERVTYIDKIRAVLHAQLALISAECSKAEEFEAYIRKAHHYATRFDLAPDFDSANIRFFHDTDLSLILVDGLGNSADDAIRRFVFAKATPSPALDAIRSRYDALRQASL